jgi:hypothetical protein
MSDKELLDRLLASKIQFCPHGLKHCELYLDKCLDYREYTCENEGIKDLCYHEEIKGVR